MDILFKPL